VKLLVHLSPISGNSVFEPLAKWDRYITGELLRGYREIAEGLIFGNRTLCLVFALRGIFQIICEGVLRGRGEAIFAPTPVPKSKVVATRLNYQPIRSESHSK
jgi:hypothetical protein